MELKAVKNIKFVDGGVCAAKGFKANGIQCGLAHAGASVTKKKNDLALIVADTECTAAAVYTTNKVKGAPILVTKEHLKNGRVVEEYTIGAFQGKGSYRKLCKCQYLQC